jgi:glutathione S-transferase
VAVLLTIPISHYCDKARWALEHCRVPYVERAHLQAFHWLFTWRAARTRTVPLLVTEHGVFTDSTDILRFANESAPGDRKIYPADVRARGVVDALEELFDEQLGPATRRWIYPRLFRKTKLIYRYGDAGVPLWERALLPIALPPVRAMITKHLGTSDGSLARAEETIERIFLEVEARIAGGARFLAGDSLTAADISFASLAAPVLLPRQYGVPLPEPSDLGAETDAAILRWRASAAGQFALRLYREHRVPRCG